MSYLLDTDVLAELRKGSRGDPGVRRWFRDHADEPMFVSALVLGEVRRGVELKRRRDPTTASLLDEWLATLESEFADRVLAVDARVADAWGRMNVPNRMPAVDGLMAATAHVHGLTLVARNVSVVASADVPLVNPFGS